MANVYEIRVKAAALDEVKRARDALREEMGTRQIGRRLAGMSEADAGELANRLLAFLDAVDAVVSRAKPQA